MGSAGSLVASALMAGVFLSAVVAFNSWPGSPLGANEDTVFVDTQPASYAGAAPAAAAASLLGPAVSAVASLPAAPLPASSDRGSGGAELRTPALVSPLTATSGRGRGDDLSASSAGSGEAGAGVSNPLAGAVEGVRVDADGTVSKVERTISEVVRDTTGRLGAVSRDVDATVERVEGKTGLRTGVKLGR